MDRKHFYRECYLRTGGWLPMQPLTQAIELGDFCQIRDGGLRPLGNIVNLDLAEAILLSGPLQLNPLDWRLTDGVKQVFCASERRVDQAEPEVEQGAVWTRQMLEFDREGSFLFHGRSPSCQLIMNWSQFKASATLRLTQEQYCFQEPYIVTGIAIAERWGLAIAGGPGAQLELSAAIRDTDYASLLSHHSSNTEQCKNIAIFEKSSQQPAYFFKAKKLVLKDGKRDEFLNQIVESAGTVGAGSVANWLNGNWLSLLNREQMLKDSHSCLAYFDWADITLDEVEKLG